MRALLGEVAERLNAAVSKTVGPGNRSRGFKSPPLRLEEPRTAYMNPVDEAGFSRLWGELGSPFLCQHRVKFPTCDLPADRGLDIHYRLLIYIVYGNYA